MSGIAFFDVDDTILKGSTGIMLARMMFFDVGETVSLNYALDMARAYIVSKIGTIEYDELVEKGLERFRGRSRAEIEALCELCFDNYMRKAIYQGAYKRIRWHKSMGHQVVLLTASILPLVRLLSEFLGCNEAIALDPIFENGVMTTTATKPYCYEDGKRILAREYAQKFDVDLKDCYFYSDSSSDLPLMRVVGHPCPTNPDTALTIEALLHNWRIFRFHSVLPTDFKPERD